MSNSIESVELILTERVLETDTLGPLRILATEDAVVAITFAEHRRAPVRRAQQLRPDAAHRVLDQAARELDEYLRPPCVRRSFTVPTAPQGTTFQRAVWDALRNIPFGETRSYSEIAVVIGRPRAVRAVGAANALNPISLVVPCHRVIGITGELTGYAGGMERKRWLLCHEHNAAARTGDKRVVWRRTEDAGRPAQF